MIQDTASLAVFMQSICRRAQNPTGQKVCVCVRLHVCIVKLVGGLNGAPVKILPTFIVFYVDNVVPLWSQRTTWHMAYVNISERAFEVPFLSDGLLLHDDGDSGR